MRNKRFLSTVVATALVVTTMAMPVMAEEQTGSVNVDVLNKTGVLRVQVPTKMTMEIDQFEIGHVGAQIASSEFAMHNYSEMDVKVVTTSTATLKSGVSLVDSKEAAAKSTKDEAWLAVAAQTDAGKYDDKTTADKTEDYWDLSDTNANVKSFAKDTNKAEQTFYLAKGTAGTDYKIVIPDASGNIKADPVAQFYELSAATLATSDDPGLQALVDTADVYVSVTASEADDADLTLIPKGTTVAGGANAYAGTNTYYTADPAASTPEANKKYVYAAKATVGGEAAFKYVGKLSDAKASWTKEDITAVGINYTITGITATNYDQVKDDCTYGLYKEKPAEAAPSIATTSYPMAANTAIDIVVDLGLGDLAANGVSKVMDPTGAFDYLSGGYATYDSANKKITLLASMVDACIAGNVSSVDVIFDDTALTSVTISLTN